jgi:hydrogenase maturation factor
VSCNDVATSGNRPQFVETVVMVGEEEGEERIEEISRGIARAAKRLRVDVVGGHTERAPGLHHSIVVTTAFAFAQDYVTATSARSGDAIILTKTAGIEGTSILASNLEERLSRLGAGTLREGRGLSRMIGAVDEAEAAFREGGVHAMHDPTEGGVLGGLYEMAVGAGLGFKVEERKIPLARSTREITNALGVDPLRLIASGSMLMAVTPQRVTNVLAAIKAARVDATVVGKFGGSERVILKKDGRKEKVDETVLDELWRIVGGGGQWPKRR